MREEESRELRTLMEVGWVRVSALMKRSGGRASVVMRALCEQPQGSHARTWGWALHVHILRGHVGQLSKDPCELINTEMPSVCLGFLLSPTQMGILTLPKYLGTLIFWKAGHQCQQVVWEGKVLATVFGWGSGDTALGYSPTSSTLSTHSTICLAPKQDWIAPLDPPRKWMISGCVFLFLLSKGIFGKWYYKVRHLACKLLMLIDK